MNALKPSATVEELEQALGELTVHFDKTVQHLEEATRLIGKQGSDHAQALRWLKDIRKAAGATAPGISHQELCLIIKDLRRRAFQNSADDIMAEQEHH